MGAMGFEILLGSLTTTGSLIAFGKLQGILPGQPLVYRGQNIFNMSLAGGHDRALYLSDFCADGGHSVLHHARARLCLWRAAGAADWVSGHAGGHVAPEFIRRSGFGSDGICAGQQRSDYCRARSTVSQDSFFPSSCAAR
jgi:hypothetical protein